MTINTTKHLDRKLKGVLLTTVLAVVFAICSLVATDGVPNHSTAATQVVAQSQVAATLLVTAR
jgi:hypothetical protein